LINPANVARSHALCRACPRFLVAAPALGDRWRRCAEGRRERCRRKDRSRQCKSAPKCDLTRIWNKPLICQSHLPSAWTSGVPIGADWDPTKLSLSWPTSNAYPIDPLHSPTSLTSKYVDNIETVLPALQGMVDCARPSFDRFESAILVSAGNRSVISTLRAGWPGGRISFRLNGAGG